MDDLRSASPDEVASPPWLDGPYSIKRHGVSITNCDDEPVQTPGCVQDHGVLLVLRPSDLLILQASENTGRWLGPAPRALLGLPVGAVLGADIQAKLRVFVDREPLEANPLHLTTLPARNGVPPLDATVHTLEGVVLLELEATGRTGAGDPDLFDRIRSAVTRLHGADTLRGYFDRVTNEVRALTGFDRVMAYRFHDDGHGEVFAESRDERLAPWLGFHYPASDIPQPAREVFRRIWLRPTPVVGSPVHELVPLARPDTGRPLTMTYCALRGASVMYTEYLHNMRVTAGLTLSVRDGERLWGLIACHHHAGPRHVPWPVRAACEFLAQVVSLQFRSAEEREHLVYRLHLEEVHQQLVTQAAHEGGLAAMADAAPTLLDGMTAGGAAILHDDRWRTVGETPGERELESLAAWLATRPELDSPTRPLFSTDALPALHPPAAGYSHLGAGLLAFPLSRGRRNLVMWFRPEVVRTIRWGGNPDEKPTVTGPHGPRLTPRASFELFEQSVRGRSLPWLPVEVEAAARFRFLLMEMVVSRAERLAALNADLARSNEELDAFAYVASHDLKEPLRGIHKYAHQLLAEAVGLEAEHRRRLEALLRLTVRMDSLLDSLLHFSRVGRTVLLREAVDLGEVIGEAIEMVSGRAGETVTEFVVPRPMPVADCDRMRVREVFVNLLSNAIKYTVRPHQRVEIGWVAPGETADRSRWPEPARRERAYYVRDDGIGIPLRHAEQVFRMFKRLHGRDAFGGGAGVGLTIVRKLVERHRGSVWIESAPGAGTTVWFTVPGDDSEGRV